MRRFGLIAALVLAVAVTAGNVYGEESTYGVYDIRHYGAAGDGTTLDTKAIQSAVDACSKTGGEVLFTPGTYVSGTIFMKSGVTLRLMTGAVLLGSPYLKDYPETTPKIRSWTDRYVCRSLIYGEGVENVAIVGGGTIDGNGHGPEFQEAGYTLRTRPYIIRFISSSGVTLRDIFLTRSPMWMQHYLECDHVTLRGVRVYNHGNRNNDSVDIDGCSHVVISDCIFDSDDDAITLKSTSPAVTSNVAITNCIASSHCNAIKMGTESHGGFKNVAISNCTITPSRNEAVVYGRSDGHAGIALEIVDGGVMDGIVITNITIERVRTPLFVRLGNRARQYTESVPVPGVGALRNVTISNVTARGTSPASSSITGIPGFPVENITLRDIRILCPGGGTAEYAAREVPEVENKYPESSMFGESLPAFGLYIRHAKHLSMDNVRFILEQPDERPALVCDDVRGLDIVGLKADTPSGYEPVARLVDTRDALVRGCRAEEGTGTFLEVCGVTSESITLSGNDLDRADTTVRNGVSVPSGVVRIR